MTQLNLNLLNPVNTITDAATHIHTLLEEQVAEKPSLELTTTTDLPSHLWIKVVARKRREIHAVSPVCASSPIGTLCTSTPAEFPLTTAELDPCPLKSNTLWLTRRSTDVP